MLRITFKQSILSKISEVRGEEETLSAFVERAIKHYLDYLWSVNTEKGVNTERCNTK